MNGVCFRSPIGDGRTSHATIGSAEGVASNAAVDCAIDTVDNVLAIGTAAGITNYLDNHLDSTNLNGHYDGCAHQHQGHQYLR